MNSPITLPDSQADDHDLLEFAAESSDSEASSALSPWLILMVDDDRDVHDTTLMSMRGMEIEGRPLKFLQAFSSVQAREFLATHHNIAAVLLDVVMESEDAGLQLVRAIRQEFEMESVQIILRTGQPGFAPEIETIQKYEINDYQNKTELSLVRLYTSLTGAIRTYQHLHAMEETRRELEVVVQSSAELSKARSLQSFANGLLVQFCALMNVPTHGVVCSGHARFPEAEARVIVAAGAHAPFAGNPVADLPNGDARHAIQTSLKLHTNLMGFSTTLYFAAPGGQALVVHVDHCQTTAMDQQVIMAFCSSMTVGLENVLLHERMYSLAYEDQLLGVANRNRFLELVQERIDQFGTGVVAVIDLDDFAGDNAMFGHEFGDALLKTFVQRLSETFGPEVGLARLSSDTFALVGSDERITPRMLAQCSSSIMQVLNQVATVSATAGLVRIEDGSEHSAELLKQAYVALKIAKTQHRGDSMYYSEAMGTDATERSTLLRRLREAFEAHRLFVVYQPQVLLTDSSTIGAEALLRWRTEDGKFVPPDQFIPVAEQSGLMISIGEFVLRTACHQLRVLNDLGYPNFRMSVNVSQVQFRDPAFVRTVKRALADVGISPRNLELEITESMAAEELDFVLRVLNELKTLGVTIAIDDFGTGYSSLSILGQLQLDRLKIDKSFVSELSESAGVAKSIIDIARSLKLDLIAEGVETEQQASDLLSMGCTEAQGYLFSRPLAPPELLTWLKGRP
jgi:diguanylate cyclase (GGDEF)-like protein